MNDGVAAVDEHPFTGFLAFKTDHAAAGSLDLFFDVFRKRHGVTVRSSGGEDGARELIGQFFRVEHDDVLAFDLNEGVDDNALKLSDIHKS